MLSVKPLFLERECSQVLQYEGVLVTGSVICFVVILAVGYTTTGMYLSFKHRGIVS